VLCIAPEVSILLNKSRSGINNSLLTYKLIILLSGLQVLKKKIIYYHFSVSYSFLACCRCVHNVSSNGLWRQCLQTAVQRLLGWWRWSKYKWSLILVGLWNCRLHPVIYFRRAYHLACRDNSSWQKICILLNCIVNISYHLLLLFILACSVPKWFLTNESYIILLEVCYK